MESSKMKKLIEKKSGNIMSSKKGIQFSCLFTFLNQIQDLMSCIL